MRVRITVPQIMSLTASVFSELITQLMTPAVPKSKIAAIIKSGKDQLKSCIKSVQKKAAASNKAGTAKIRMLVGFSVFILL